MNINEVPEDVSARTTRATGIMGTVLAYFDKHPNQILHLNDIAEGTGFPKEKVRDAINNIRTGNKADAKTRLKVEVQGQAWLWRSGKVEGRLDTLYVKAYESKSGVILVESEDGTLYKLVPIEY